MTTPKAEEIWRDINGYEGIYQASNMGKIKSLCRKYSPGEQILKTINDKDGYKTLSLTKKGIRRTKKVHQLVVNAFLNHNPCGMKLVVNHKDFNRQNNNVENLEIITTRNNSSKSHIKHSSKYTGVSLTSDKKKWSSRITYDGYTHRLGYFNNEYDAHLAYQNKLKEITND